MSGLDVALSGCIKSLNPKIYIYPEISQQKLFCSKKMHRITIHLLNISLNLKEWDEVPPQVFFSVFQPIKRWFFGHHLRIKKNIYGTDGWLTWFSDFSWFEVLLGLPKAVSNWFPLTKKNRLTWPLRWESLDGISWNSVKSKNLRR